MEAVGVLVAEAQTVVATSDDDHMSDHGAVRRYLVVVPHSRRQNLLATEQTAVVSLSLSAAMMDVLGLNVKGLGA